MEAGHPVSAAPPALRSTPRRQFEGLFAGDNGAPEATVLATTSGRRGQRGGRSRRPRCAREVRVQSHQKSRFVQQWLQGYFGGADES